tara:strand:+ start:3202 stop:3678 length:477 start_codon:yes stop_codon:yes gene_type:complete
MSEELVEEIEPNIQKTLDSDQVVQKFLTGEEFTDDLLGIKVKPVTLATLGFMAEAGCQLIQGANIDEIDNVILEVLLFIYIHTAEHKELSEISCLEENPKAKFKQKAFEMGMEVEPSQIPNLLEKVVTILQDATSTKAEPLPNEDVQEGDKKKEIQEI